MAIGAFLGAVAGGQASSAAGGIFGGIQRGVEYASNRLVANNSLGYDAYALLYGMGLLPPDAFASHMSQLGFNVSAQDFATNDLLKQDARGVLRINTRIWTGDTYYEDRWNAIKRSLPGPDEVLVLLNRKLITPHAAEWLLRLAFGGEKDLAKSWMNLRYQIPGATDLVAFAVKDCFSPDIVTQFQYNKELPTAILPFMEAQGLGGNTGVTLPPGSTNTEGNDNRTNAQWFDLYWWSHWELPSVGQGYEMLQRLYANSMYGPSPNANADTYFPESSLELLQKANDYPPYWRKRLQALSYTPLGRIDIKRLYASGILKEDDANHDVFHAYRANGYNDIDAKRLTDYVVKKAKPDILNLTIKQVDRLYKQGSLGDRETVDALIKLDFNNREATYHVENMKLEIQADTVDFKLKYVRIAFLTGDISEDDVKAYFLGMHLQQSAQDLYLARWKMQLEVTYKHVSLDKAITLFKEGYITSDQLRNKLNNLRYPIVEQELLILKATNDIAIREAKDTIATAKAIAAEAIKAQNAADKLATSAKAQSEKEQSRLAKLREKASAADKSAFSEKNIIAFYKAKFVNEEQIRNILGAKGWLPDTIETWMDTFTPFDDKGEPSVKVKKAPPNSPTTTTNTGQRAGGLPGSTQAITDLPKPL